MTPYAVKAQLVKEQAEKSELADTLQSQAQGLMKALADAHEKDKQRSADTDARKQMQELDIKYTELLRQKSGLMQSCIAERDRALQKVSALSLALRQADDSGAQALAAAEAKCAALRSALDACTRELTSCRASLSGEMAAHAASKALLAQARDAADGAALDAEERAATIKALQAQLDSVKRRNADAVELLTKLKASAAANQSAGGQWTGGGVGAGAGAGARRPSTGMATTGRPGALASAMAAVDSGVSGASDANKKQKKK